MRLFPGHDTTGALWGLALVCLVGSARSHTLPQRTAILVHGCHLEADGWEQAVWGDIPSQRMGRLPHAALLALREDAVLMVLGTGGSARGGIYEGEYTLQYLRRNLPRLYAFDAVRDEGINLAALATLVEDISVCETSSKNTIEELEEAGKLFARAGVNRVILVSSPAHLPRCLKTAVAVFGAAGYRPTLFSSPCETCFSGCEAEDVVVIEPPHRGDRDKSMDGSPLALHRLAARALRVPAHRKLSFASSLDALLRHHTDSQTTGDHKGVGSSVSTLNSEHDGLVHSAKQGASNTRSETSPTNLTEIDMQST